MIDNKEHNEEVFYEKKNISGKAGNCFEELWFLNKSG